MTRLSLLILLMLCPIAVAAPPTITHLFPAGGQRGTKVSVTAVGTFSWPVQVWASDKGITVTPGKQKGELTVAIAADVAPGVHWLRAHDKEGGGNLRPFIVGTLPEVVEKEPNDEPTQAQQLKGPVVVNGRLEKRGDVDCFAVEAKKGQTLVASLEANHTLKSPMDAILQVLSATGGVLEQNHDFHGLDPQVMFPVPKDGTYIVRVFAFPELPDGTIGFAGAANYVYRLTITTGGFADHALPLAVSRSTPGKVRLVGWNLPESARVLPVPKDGVLTVPDVVNTALVRLEPHATYDDTEPGAKFTEPLATPFTVTGRLANRESVAGYRFLGKKGQPLTFQAESQALGFPLVPVLRILDAGGKQLARAEATPPNDIELSFTPPADGTYRVEVRDLYDEGSVRHLFRLRVIRPEPDFALTVAGDRFTLAPGKPLDILVTVMRRNGFAGAVDVSAENLPAGVTAKMVSDAKGILLRLSAEKEAGGSFRIVGKARGKPGIERTASAILKDFGATADLWLTATPGKTGAKK
jgi:Bacterial pre-peptidase C-terminal domain